MERRRGRVSGLNAELRRWRQQMAQHRNLTADEVDELEDHLREQVRELVDSGRAESEAFRLAVRRLGEPGSLQAAFHASRGRWRPEMQDLLRSLRHSGRRLLRSPGFSVVAVLTLALGIGSTTTIFTLVHSILLEPLPYPRPERLFAVSHTAPGFGYDEIPQSRATYLTYREHAETLQGIGLYFPADVAVTGRGRPQQLPAMRVTPGIFSLLGVRPHLGRLLVESDRAPGSPLHVVLDHGYWQSALGADPAAVGRTLRIDGSPHEIVGVLPAWFHILDNPGSLYLPLRYDPADVRLTDFSYMGVARLRDGVEPEQARRELGRLLPVAAAEYPGGLTEQMLQEGKVDARVTPLKTDLVGDVSTTLWVLLGTVGVILLIAWVNVFNLFAVRLERLRHEMAVRAALGAGRARLWGIWFREGILIALLGGTGGVGLAAAATRLVVALAPEGLPRLDRIDVDATVLLFNLLLSLSAGLLLGLLPLLRRRTIDVSSALKDGIRGGAGGGRDRLRSAMAVAEVALALVLIVAAGLMTRSLSRLLDVDPGFRRAERVLAFRLPIPYSEIRSSAEAAAVVTGILDGIAAVPGVESVGATSSYPLEGRSAGDSIEVEEIPVAEGELPPIHRLKFIAGDYFQTLQIPLLAGRLPDRTDFAERRPVAVVSEGYARTYWSDPAQALGKRIRPTDSRWHEIIGVTGDVHDHGPAQQAPPLVYIQAYGKEIWENEDFFQRQLAYVVRTRTPPATLLPQIERAIWSVNANLPLSGVLGLDTVLRRSMARTSFTLLILGTASAIAVLLGAIGVYGVLSYAAAQRTREIGVRMALGADAGAIRRMMLRQGGLVAGLGAAIGLLAAFGFSRGMASLLFGVSPTDPGTYVVAALVVASMALGASYLPARRAAGVDPMRALRWE